MYFRFIYYYTDGAASISSNTIQIGKELLTLFITSETKENFIWQLLVIGSFNKYEILEPVF